MVRCGAPSARTAECAREPQRSVAARWECRRRGRADVANEVILFELACVVAGDTGLLRAHRSSRRCCLEGHREVWGRADLVGLAAHGALEPTRVFGKAAGKSLALVVFLAALGQVIDVVPFFVFEVIAHVGELLTRAWDEHLRPGACRHAGDDGCHCATDGKFLEHG